MKISKSSQKSYGNICQDNCIFANFGCYRIYVFRLLLLLLWMRPFFDVQGWYFNDLAIFSIELFV